LSKIRFAHYLSRSMKLMHEVDRDDVIGEAMLALIKAAETWNPDHERSAFAAYAKVCIQRRMCTYLRRHHRRRCVELVDVADNSPPAGAVLATREQADRNWELVQELPPVLRFVFVQHLGLVDGVARTFRELAAEMDLPVDRTRALYLAAMARFRQPA